MRSARQLLAPPFADLAALPRARLAAMRRAADELFEVLETFAREGRHPVRDLLASASPFTRLEHYPPGDVDGGASGCTWYYHAHDPSPARAWEEHGHFHCFLYSELMPAGAKPVALPKQPDFEKGGLCHLVALVFDERGAPTRLFTINRWASDEWMYPARHLVPLIDRYTLGADKPFPLTSRLLGATLRLLQPQIAWALHERDRVIAAHASTDPAGATEDFDLEVTSLVTFDLDAHLEALDRAWERKARRAA